MGKISIKTGFWVIHLFCLSVVAPQAQSEVLARSILSASDSLMLQQQHDRSTEGLLYDLYSGLLTLNSRGEAEPEIAKHWTVSDDGLTWTFKLREDALWSDGVSVTAWDFVYAFRNLRHASSSTDRLNGLYKLIKNGRDLVDNPLQDDALLGVRAIDRYTLELQLEYPVADFPDRLTRIEAMPLPEHAFSMFGSDWAKHGKIINNGPYLLEENKQNRHYVLQKNPRYFKRTDIKFDQVHVLVEDDFQKLLKMFQAGKLDIVEGFEPRQRKWLKKYRPDVIYELPAKGLVFLSVNATSKKLKDFRVRKAMSLAVDRDLIASRIYQTMDPLSCFLPTSIRGYLCKEVESEEKSIETRIEQANLLMRQAGFSNRKLKIKLRTEKHAGHEFVVPAIINMWKRINIDTVLTMNDQSPPEQEEQDFDMELVVWASDENDVSNYLLDFIGMLTKRNHRPEFQQLISHITDNNEEESFQLFRKIEEELAGQYYIIPVSSLLWRFLVREDIAGWGQSVNGTHPARWLYRKNKE